MHSSNSSKSSFVASSDSNQVDSTWNKSLNSRGMFASVDNTGIGTSPNLGSIRDGGYIRDTPSVSPYQVSSASTYKPNIYRSLTYSSNPPTAKQVMDRSANTSAGSSSVEGLLHPKMLVEHMSCDFSQLRAQPENRTPTVEFQDYEEAAACKRHNNEVQPKGIDSSWWDSHACKRQRTDYICAVDQQLSVSSSSCIDSLGTPLQKIAPNINTPSPILAEQNQLVQHSTGSLKWSSLRCSVPLLYSYLSQFSENEQRSSGNHNMLVPTNLRESTAERKDQQEARRILKPGDPRQEHYDRTHRKDLSTSPIHGIWGDVENLIKGYNNIQKADFYRERSRRIEEQKDMFAKKKLSLVLDLHSLLHHATILDIIEFSYYEKLKNKEEEDCIRPLRHLYQISKPSIWIKLRPGIWNFLEKASQLYELHLLTTWNKKLAAEIEKEIDPSGALFGGRIICVGEPSINECWNDTIKRVHKNLDEVKGLESAVIIMDICKDSWPHNKHNLVLVERYTYFPSKEQHRGHKDQSPLICDLDEPEENGPLASALAVLERIHHSFFAEQCLEKMDVRTLLAAEKKKILAGCRIVFSGLFGLHEANPQKYNLWQLAEQFGAVCTTKMDSEVTHVVPFIGKTDKVKMALAEGKHVVSRRWIEDSSLSYRRAKETDYPFDFVTKNLFHPKLK